MAKPEDFCQFIIRRALPRPFNKRVEWWYKFHTADFTVVSFPKSGRTWLRAMLSHVFHQAFELSNFQLLQFANLHQLDKRIPRILFTHDEPYKVGPDKLSGNKNKYYHRRLVYLVRDPRDVVVSMYFHRTRRDRDLTVSLPEFVFGEQGGLSTVLAFYNNWAKELAKIKCLLVLRYEDMRADTPGKLSELFHFMGLQIGYTTIRSAVEQADFARMKEIEDKGEYARGYLRPGDKNDQDSFKVRRGKVGGYVDYFSPDELAEINARIAEQLDPFYGYGRDPQLIAALGEYR